MRPRLVTLVAVAALLAMGCSPPSAPTDGDAGPTADAAEPETATSRSLEVPDLLTDVALPDTFELQDVHADRFEDGSQEAMVSGTVDDDPTELLNWLTGQLEQDGWVQIAVTEPSDGRTQLVAALDDRPVAMTGLITSSSGGTELLVAVMAGPE